MQLYQLALLSLTLLQANAKLNSPMDRFDWLIGTWHSVWDGDVEWPTIPPMKFGENITFGEAPVSQSANAQFVNMTSIAWSHNTKDHFHNEHAYLQTDRFGKVMYFGIGNNAFATVEEGTITRNTLNLESVHIGRAEVARELPVEKIRREFRLIAPDLLEQRLFMRTLTHPLRKDQDRIHATNLYKKIS